MSSQRKPDPLELQRILALPLEEQEAMREAELAAAIEELDKVTAQLIVSSARDRVALAKRHEEAAQRAHNCRSRKPWLWSKGQRW